MTGTIVAAMAGLAAGNIAPSRIAPHVADRAAAGLLPRGLRDLRGGGGESDCGRKATPKAREIEK